MIDFTFLGTSSGTPTKHRNVSGLALRKSDSKQWYLVDCGEGTQHQLLHVPYSLHTLQAIFITHCHGDHCLGLPGLLSTASLSQRKTPLQIIAPKEVQDFVNNALRLTDCHLSFELMFSLPHPNQALIFENDFDVTPVTLSHRAESVAYHFRETKVSRHLNTEKLLAEGIPPGPSWGKLKKGSRVTLENGTELQPEDYFLPPRKKLELIVGGDNDSPELLFNAARTTEVLIHEATFTEQDRQRVGMFSQHSSANMVATFAENAQIPNLILTHFSARYNTPSALQSIIEEATDKYHGNLLLARDLDTYILKVNGNLKEMTRNANKP